MPSSQSVWGQLLHMSLWNQPGGGGETAVLLFLEVQNGERKEIKHQMGFTDGGRGK